MKKKVKDIALFRDAGGVPSWSEWQAMDVGTKAAFVAVGRQRRVEDAIRIGRATSGPRGVLEVVAEIDNGNALEDALLQAAVIDAAG